MNEEAILKQFYSKISTQFDVKKLTVYKHFDNIYGDTLDCVQIERYLSLSCTAIFKDENGSSLVSHVRKGNNLYVFVLSSDSSEAYDGVEAQYIINEFKILNGKLGEIQ